MTAKNKGGRPAIDWPTLIPQIEEYAAKGLPLDAIAHLVGTSPTSLLRHRKKRADVQAAVDRGRARLHDDLVEKLDQHILEGNVASLLFKLKAFFGYRDNSQAPPVNEQKKPVAKTIKYARKD